MTCMNSIKSTNLPLCVLKLKGGLGPGLGLSDVHSGAKATPGGKWKARHLRTSAPRMRNMHGIVRCTELLIFRSCTELLRTPPEMHGIVRNRGDPAIFRQFGPKICYSHARNCYILQAPGLPNSCNNFVHVPITISCA